MPCSRKHITEQQQLLIGGALLGDPQQVDISKGDPEVLCLPTIPTTCVVCVQWGSCRSVCVGERVLVWMCL